MKRLILLAVLGLTITSCSVTQPLYYWGGEQKGTSKYENLAYMSYDKQTPESMCRLICVYEDMVNNPAGSRQVPPPGICAEYGYLLLQPQTAETFAKHATPAQRSAFKDADADYAVLFRARGEEMMKMEMTLYPESVHFIKPIFEKLTK